MSPTLIARLALTLWLIVPCAFAHTTAAPSALGANSSPLAEQPPPLAARYEVRLRDPQQGKEIQQTWYFIREAQRISLLKPDFDEIWERDGAGRLSFQRAFHQQQRLVEYSFGELRNLGIVADWDSLSRMIDLHAQRQLKPKGSGTLGGRKVKFSRGKIGADAVELAWLEAQQIPAQLQRKRPQLSSRIELKELHSQALPTWPTSAQRSASYSRVDAADFGDMESDPFIHHAEQVDVLSGWRRSHHHAQ